MALGLLLLELLPEASDGVEAEASDGVDDGDGVEVEAEASVGVAAGVD